MEKDDFNLGYYAKLKHRKLQLENRVNLDVDGEEKENARKLLKNVNQKLNDYETKYSDEISNLYTKTDNFAEFYKEMDEDYEKWKEAEKTSKKQDKILLILLVCYGIFLVYLLFILAMIIFAYIIH